MQKSYDSLKDNDIEVILLAYLLKHPELLDTHFEQISNNLFANPENLKIFKVLEDFHQSQKNISIDTIKNYIPDIQSQTLKDLSLQIDQIVFSKEIFLNYIESLQELYLRRELFKLTQDKNNESTTFQTSNNIKEIFLDLEKKIFDLSNFKKENYEFKDFATVTRSSLQLVEKAFKKKGKYSGVVSGFNDLDNMLGGLQNSDLVILAGRPSMGKTALATNIAFNAAKKLSPIFFLHNSRPHTSLFDARLGHRLTGDANLKFQVPPLSCSGQLGAPGPKRVMATSSPVSSTIT